MSKRETALLKKYVLPEWPRAVLLGLLLLGGIATQLANPQIAKTFIDQAQAGVSLPRLVHTALLFLVVAFTILGSFFIPFLAATLLHMNNRVPWKPPIRHNRAATNIALAFVLLVFLVVGALEVRSLL